MTRLFLQLFAPVFIVTTLFIVNANFVFEPIFNLLLGNRSNYGLQEIICFLDDGIDGMSSVKKVDRKEKVKQLQNQFQFDIGLLDIQDVHLPDSKKKKLEQGEYVSEIENKKIVYHLSSHSGQAWKLDLTPGDSEGKNEYTKRLAAGPLEIIIERLLSKLESEWKQELAHMSLTFNIPLTLLTLDTVDLKPQDLKNLTAQKTIVFTDPYLKHIYTRIQSTNYVVQLGPFEHPFIVKHANQIFVGALGLPMGVVVWFLLRPVWHDLRNLQAASHDFGKGQLQARVNFSKRSPIKNILHSFNAMAAHIQQLVASHKELTRAVSHELRTPVSRLRFSLEMLEETNDKIAHKRYLKEMNTDIEELNDLLGELLSYARMDRSQDIVEYSPVILTKWLEEQTTQLKRDCNQKSVEVKHTGLPLQTVECMDPKLMARALNNLVRNACRYANQHVHINLNHVNGNYRLSVEDDGPGIPAENIDKIFEPFARIDSSRNRGSGGYGLGLAIVQQIAEVHQGKVIVMPSKLGGAHFLISWQTA
jgi:signal transduction histidine kinase